MNREEILKNVLLWQSRIDEASQKWGGAQI